MNFYERIRDNTATKLIAKYGSRLTFTRIERGEYDPATGSSPETRTTYTARAVKDSFSVHERNDSSIQIDDIKLLVEAVDEGFRVSDLVSIDSQEYKIVRPNPIKPASTVVAYELQVRK